MTMVKICLSRMKMFLLKKVFVLLFYLLSCLPAVQNSASTFNKRVCAHHSKNGQYIIGGIFKFYGNTHSPCSGDLQLHLLSFVEAMAFAVEIVNEQSDLLPNIDLGYEIRTDCGDEDVALWTTMTLVSSVGNVEYATLCPNNKRTNNKNVMGIVGPGRSSTSLLAAKVGEVFAVPIVSHFATSDELSDSTRFPFFFRTVPADKFQVKVIIDILLHYNWKYIALFYSLDSYGIHGARQILSLADEADICVALSMPVSVSASATEMEDIRSKLMTYDKISVVVSFAVSESTLSVLQTISKFNISRKFTFIGSDAWTPRLTNFREFRSYLVGSIFVRFFSESSQKFLDHFHNLRYNQSEASIWYRDEIQEIYKEENCTTWSTCPLPGPHWNTQQIINAVYLIANALNTTLMQNKMQNIKEQQNSSEYDIDGNILQKNLLDVSFSTGPNLTFRFDNDGEVPGKYLIQSWQEDGSGYGMVDMATWDSSRKGSSLIIEDDNIQWHSDSNKVPISLCTEVCQPGFILVPLEMKCCWGCQRCNEYAVVINRDNGAACEDCQPTHWPNGNYTKCVPIAPTFIAEDSIVVLLSGTGTAIGLLLVLLTAIGLHVYKNQPLVKASSLKLCYINLIGMAVGCTSVILLNLLRPTMVTCAITSVGILTSICIAFTPILLKVNRIWRIFSLELGDDLHFASNKSQVVIAITVIFIQVLISTVAEISEYSSHPTLLLPVKRQPYLEVYCNFGYGFLSGGIYNSVIIATCCYYAFKARRVPDNFNESKFIAVSVYSQVIIFLAAIPMYTTGDNIAQKIGVLSVTLLVNTYLTLFSLYLPKLYAIHFASTDKENTECISLPSSVTQNCISGIRLPEQHPFNGTFREAPSSVVI